MVNDCIRIGLRENVTSMKSLSTKAYHQLCLRRSDPLSPYSHQQGRRNTAELPEGAEEGSDCEGSCVTRLSLTDCYGFRLIHRLVRLPVRKGEYVFIVINDRTLRSISGHTPRSLTLTTHSLSICLSKEIAEIEPVGAIGTDRNLDNVTLADSDGSILRHDLSRATEVK